LFVLKLIVEDMPEVPTTELMPEEPEKMDLPDVPTKAPVASNETTSTKRKVLEEPLEA
jgi:charged multivesicular body protein 6